MQWEVINVYNGVYDIEQFAYIQDTLMKWISDKIAGQSLSDKLIEKGVFDIAIYGIHELGKLVYKDIKGSQIQVNYFIDKRASEYPKGYQGVPVVRLEQLLEGDIKGFILVTPEFYFHDILQDLIKKGIPLEKIITIAMLV